MFMYMQCHSSLQCCILASSHEVGKGSKNIEKQYFIAVNLNFYKVVILKYKNSSRTSLYTFVGLLGLITIDTFCTEPLISTFFLQKSNHSSVPLVRKFFHPFSMLTNFKTKNSKQRSLSKTTSSGDDFLCGISNIYDRRKGIHWLQKRMKRLIY